MNNSIKLKKIIIIGMCITMFFVSSCEKQKKESEERDTHVVPYLSFDYSDRRDDLSNISEDEVLEVRWVLPDGEYRTIDDKFINEIKSKMSDIKLEPMEQIKGEIPDGFGGEFYFLNGRKALYDFHIDELGNTYVNGKVYSNKDEFKEIADYLIGITYNDERIEKIK